MSKHEIHDVLEPLKVGFAKDFLIERISEVEGFMGSLQIRKEANEKSTELYNNILNAIPEDLKPQIKKLLQEYDEYLTCIDWKERDILYGIAFKDGFNLYKTLTGSELLIND